MKKGFYLLAILLFPSIIYMLFSLGEHHVEKLGAFGAFEINAEGDTVYQSVPDVSLVNQYGQSFKLSSLSPKILVLNIYNSPCDSVCKKKGATLANYLNELNEKEKWMILNISMNQANADQLAEDSSLHNIGMDNWWFVSPTERDELLQFLNYVFVDTEQLATIEDLPSNQFVLIDQNQLVRAFFNSRIYKENRKLEDAIKLVLQEPHMSWKAEKSK